MEAMLSDGKVTEKLTKLKAQDSALWEKLKEGITWLADKIRKLYASLKPDSKEGRYVAQMRDSIEQIQQLFTKGLQDASANYQAANGQKSNSDNADSKASRRDYWRPKLNQQEWNLLNREMDRQIESSKNILDPAMKWLYASENGVEVFAVYGIGDGTVPTPLYASGKKTAQSDYDKLQRFIKGDNNDAIRNRATLDRLLKTIQNKQSKSTDSVSDTQKRGTNAKNGTVSQQQRESGRKRNTNPSSDDSSSGIKRSIRDRQYLELAKDPEANREQLRQMVDEAAKAAGYTIRAYHGTSRGDRVGNVFLPERATSGPMAFFTSDRTIAEHYAKDKKDTSLAYDEEYSDYYTQFRINKNGKSIKVQDLWQSLPYVEKQQLKEAGKHLTWDEDMENIVWDDNATHGLGNWDAYTLNLHKGNAIEALIDSWLESGELWGHESDFLQVLKLAGIDGVEYRDPDVRHEKVYDTFLRIQNPFNTDAVSNEFADGFEEWYQQQPDGKYDRDTSAADMWDKNSQTAESFLERLRDDIDNGTSYAWTSIPDSMTDYLKYLGYDGIQDLGGKNGGESHIVYVPFSSEQIKEAAPITYDDNGNVIPLSQRFDSSKSDIRYSTRDPELQKANQLLEKENTKLREDVQELKELLKLQRTVTGGTKFTKTSLEAAARYLKSTVNAKGDTKEFAAILQDFYEYIATDGEITWESVSDMAQPAIGWLQEHTRQERTEYAQDVLKHLRGSRISLDELKKQETAGQTKQNHYFVAGTGVSTGNKGLESWWPQLLTYFFVLSQTQQNKNFVAFRT